MFKTARWILSVIFQCVEMVEVLFLAYLELIVATLIVGYVAVRYIFLIVLTPRILEAN